MQVTNKKDVFYRYEGRRSNQDPRVTVSLFACRDAKRKSVKSLANFTLALRLQEGWLTPGGIGSSGFP